MFAESGSRLLVTQQNYENHVRIHKPFHLYFNGILFLTLLGAFVNYYTSLGDHQRMYSASLIVVLCFLMFQLAYFARMYAVRVQDRAIRAEENLRYFTLTGKLLPPQLGVKQIVALRFAPDSEFPGLVERTVNEELSPLQIKREIKNWRPDEARV